MNDALLVRMSGRGTDFDEKFQPGSSRSARSSQNRVMGMPFTDSITK